MVLEEREGVCQVASEACRGSSLWTDRAGGYSDVNFTAVNVADPAPPGSECSDCGNGSTIQDPLARGTCASETFACLRKDRRKRKNCQYQTDTRLWFGDALRRTITEATFRFTPRSCRPPSSHLGSLARRAPGMGLRHRANTDLCVRSFPESRLPGRSSS